MPRRKSPKLAVLPKAIAQSEVKMSGSGFKDRRNTAKSTSVKEANYDSNNFVKRRDTAPA